MGPKTHQGGPNKKNHGLQMGSWIHRWTRVRILWVLEKLFHILFTDVQCLFGKPFWHKSFVRLVRYVV